MNVNDDDNEHDADARIDAMARAAGGELRRPAPAEGLSRALAARQRRQAVRATVGGVAAAALLGAGVFAVTRGDDDQRVVPVDTTVETSVPSTAVETSTTGVPPNAAGDPEVVYSTTGFILDPDYLEKLIDPVTGQEISTRAPDGLASSEAQTALIDQFVLSGRVENDTSPAITFRLESGDLAYSFEVLPSEIPGLEEQDPEALLLFDRCGQSELTVEGAAASTLPSRVHRAAMSLDRRWLVTISSECPVAGTLEGQIQTFPAPVLLQVFDARRPDQPGRALDEVLGAVFFSPDGDYLAVETESGYRVFDLADGSEVEVADSGCRFLGGRYSRFGGPWVGASSLAVSLDCPGEPVSLLVADVATGEELRVPAPAAAGLQVDGSTDGPFLEVEVDVAHYDRPSNAWFTICARTAEQSNCWYGQGNAEPVEIPGAQEASFLPLGFTPGG